jgi:DnaJ-class molecular chaperone
MNTITPEEYDDILSHRPRNCPLCNGAGVKKEKGMIEKCETCGGEGQVLVSKIEDS